MRLLTSVIPVIHSSFVVYNIQYLDEKQSECLFLHLLLYENSLYYRSLIECLLLIVNYERAVLADAPCLHTFLPKIISSCNATNSTNEYAIKTNGVVRK